MFYDAHGNPDPNGSYEMRGGRMCLRQGASVSFEMTMFDSAAKRSTSGSIDEALRLKFAEMAKARGVSVDEMLLTMEQREIENTVAETAKAFVTAQAGKGLAAQFAKDAALITDAERVLIVAKAESKHRMSNAHLASPPPFTDRHAVAAVINAIKVKANAQGLASAHTTVAADLRVQHDTDREARKQQLRDGWRR
jgi:hypothetical protein